MGEYVIANGCGHCAEAKKRGLCDSNQCYDIGSKKGQEIAKQAKLDAVPQKVCKTKDGKYVKCKPTKAEKKKFKVG